MASSLEGFGFKSSLQLVKNHILALLANSGTETARRRKVHSPKKGSTKSPIAETTHAVKTAFCELSRGELSAANCCAVKNRSTNGRITMEIGLGLKVSECYKEVGRFVSTRVETSQPQDGVAARANAFSALIAGQAAHSPLLKKEVQGMRPFVERFDLR